MKISLDWIKDFVTGVDFDAISLKQLNDRITLAIAEVEEITRTGGDIRGVVVGRVARVEPHPASPKWSVVQVDDGQGRIRTVCGAPNVREGMTVPLAREGGAIRGIPCIGKTLKEGVESAAVICSAAELGISDDHSGVLELDPAWPLGSDIKEHIPIDDILIDIDNKSLTNRPDLWGHYGFAREIAAVFGGSLRPLEVADMPAGSALEDLSIQVLDPEKCNRYSAVKLGGIHGKKSSFTMQTRLYYCGMRPISLLVDLTNYVMLELGQPLHAFDADIVRDIVVKTPEAPIRFTTLDKVERAIGTDTLMIYNGSEPAAVAGIMGGLDSEITDRTGTVLLESANFNPYNVRRSAIGIGLRTEASTRYEKSLDTALTLTSLRRFVRLLSGYEPDLRILSNVADIVCHENKPIDLTIEKPFIDRYIGESLPDSLIVDILRRLGFAVTQRGDVFDVTVPAFRTSKDITMKVDIIEEITRIYGYDNIVPKSVAVELKPLEYNEERLTEHRVKELLAGRFGLSEVNTYVWTDGTFDKSVGIPETGTVRVKNPQSADAGILRDGMVPSLLQVVERNCKAFDEVPVFEIGKVFSLPETGGLVAEHKELCVVCATKRQKVKDLYARVKGIATCLSREVRNRDLTYGDLTSGAPWTHPGISNSISCDGTALGYLSALNPAVASRFDKKLAIVMLVIDFSAFAALAPQPVRYRVPSRFPEIPVDFNFLVDEGVRYETVSDRIRQFSDEVLKDWRFVEQYSGKQIPEGKKCLTFSFTIGSDSRTLTTEEKDAFSAKLLAHMQAAGYQLRS